MKRLDEHILKIISGGQTGVDRAALDWAISHKVDHGGWCPLNRKAGDGPIPAHFRLVETPSPGYSERTRRNVQDADATLILSRGLLVGGSKLTQRFAAELERPVLVVDLDKDRTDQVNELQRWLTASPINILNVAGPSEDRFPGIYQLAMDFLNHDHH